MSDQTEVVKVTVVALYSDGRWVQSYITVPARLVALYLSDGYDYCKALVLAGLKSGELTTEGVYRHMVEADSGGSQYFRMIDKGNAPL
jgi:hypothetical protein